jgi:hypothetical protein
MDHSSQNPYFCSQLKEVVDEEYYFGINSYSVFPLFSNYVEDYRVERRVNKKVEEKVVKEVKGIHIVLAPKEKDIPKKKGVPKKKATKVKVKVEDDDNDATYIWLDAKLLQLIVLWGEMEPKFIRNNKK